MRNRDPRRAESPFVRAIRQLPAVADATRPAESTAGHEHRPAVVQHRPCARSDFFSRTAAVHFSLSTAGLISRSGCCRSWPPRGPTRRTSFAGPRCSLRIAPPAMPTFRPRFLRMHRGRWRSSRKVLAGNSFKRAVISQRLTAAPTLHGVSVPRTVPSRSVRLPIESVLFQRADTSGRYSRATSGCAQVVAEMRAARSRAGSESARGAGDASGKQLARVCRTSASHQVDTDSSNTRGSPGWRRQGRRPSEAFDSRHHVDDRLRGESRYRRAADVCRSGPASQGPDGVGAGACVLPRIASARSRRTERSERAPRQSFFSLALGCPSSELSADASPRRFACPHGSAWPTGAV